jgi:capsular exopolysaccharide synthesis family protein
MSKFIKALEQAEADRTIVERARSAPGPSAPHSEPAFGAGAPPPVASRDAVKSREPAAASSLDAHLVSLVAPASFEAEQYRTLRHIVEQEQRAVDLQVLAVSSPGAGDGKTLTAINLAGALGQGSDTRVLLVDGDLRQPAVARRLNLGHPDRPGLVDATLDPLLGVGRVVRPVHPFNLWVLPAGRPPASPYELFKSPRFAELLDEARRQFDYVVLDTPPMVGVPDCRVLARHVDAFVVVVSAHRTPRRLLAAALGTVEPAKILGLVYNGDDRLFTDYYSYRSSGDHGGGGVAGDPARWGVPLLRRLVPGWRAAT